MTPLPVYWMKPARLDMNQTSPVTSDFTEINQLIVSARQRTVQAVNTALIDLYWQVGKIISHKIATAEWGDGVV